MKIYLSFSLDKDLSYFSVVEIAQKMTHQGEVFTYVQNDNVGLFRAHSTITFEIEVAETRFLAPLLNGEANYDHGITRQVAMTVVEDLREQAFDYAKATVGNVFMETQLVADSYGNVQSAYVEV